MADKDINLGDKGNSAGAESKKLETIGQQIVAQGGKQVPVQVVN